MSLPQSVTLFEVGPRDGLQNEQPVSLSSKVALVNALSDSGLTHIETGAFVSPRWVPQMADSNQVFSKIERSDKVSYTALVPNIIGFDAALQHSPDEVAVFTTCSESFSRKNTNCSVPESLQRFTPVLEKAKANNIHVRAYLSCVVDCPYEGPTSPQRVLTIAKQLLNMGCYQVSLGDTIGTGTPKRIQAMLDCLLLEIQPECLAVHFHDTWGQALANIHQSLLMGISTIDTSVAGLGGCPYAKGASGNVATEDVIYLCHGMGISTGIDLEAIAKAGWEICKALNRRPSSKVSLALKSNLST